MINVEKKGQVFENLQAIIIPLVAIGIILVVGFLIFDESKDKILDIQDTSGWCINTLYGAYVLDTSGGSAQCCNATGCTTDDAVGNYTYNVSANVCCLTNTNDGGDPVVNCDAANITTPSIVTSCLAGNNTPARTSLAWNGTESTQNAMQDIPGWLPIIIITVIGAILIGLVSMFGRTR